VPLAPAPERSAVSAARTAVFVTFALNGFTFASWLSRLPETRTAMGLTAGQLGVVLLVGAVGSVAALPLAGGIAARLGTSLAVTASGLTMLVLLVGASAAAHLLHSPVLTAAGLLLAMAGTAVWDVAMNLEGAEVERHWGRSTMPAFHASFSLGTVGGAAGGALMAWLRVPVPVHLLGAAVLVGIALVASSRRFLPVQVEAAAEGAEGAPEAPRRSALAAWGEGRTLLIGVLVLAAAFTEGTANDWLAIALQDGYGVSPAVGALGFAAFVAAMTAARLVGTRALDRWGRVPVLRATMLLALLGSLLTVFGQSLPLAFAGAVVWGAGASLGFPVGMSAAADDPLRAAQRVSVVATIGYTAFLAGPPLIGFLADHLGSTLQALLVVAAIAVPSLLVSRVAAPPSPVPEEGQRPAPSPAGA